MTEAKPNTSHAECVMIRLMHDDGFGFGYRFGLRGSREESLVMVDIGGGMGWVEGLVEGWVLGWEW